MHTHARAYSCGERKREKDGEVRNNVEWRSTHALAPSHTRALDARPAKRAARLLFKAFPFIVSTMCSVTRGRNSQPPRCGGPLRRVKRSFIFLFFFFSFSPFLFYYPIRLLHLALPLWALPAFLRNDDPFNPFRATPIVRSLYTCNDKITLLLYRERKLSNNSKTIDLQFVEM